MNIRCYITLKKGNQREPNPRLLRGSQALKPMRYKALLEKRPNKRVYKQLYNRFFSKMAEHWTQIPLLKYSPGRVLYYKKKKKPY